jgi:hypothetical protein
MCGKYHLTFVHCNKKLGTVRFVGWEHGLFPKFAIKMSKT